MRQTIHSLKSLWQDESGQDVIEYALLASLIALAAVGHLHTFGSTLRKTYTNIGTDFTKHKTYKM